MTYRYSHLRARGHSGQPHAALWGLGIWLLVLSGAGSGCTDSGSGESSDAGTGGSGGTGPAAADVPLSPYIVLDQFGYRPESKKVAVLRDPEVGFDADGQFTPGDTCAVIDANTEEQVWEGPVVAWADGATNDQSGDRAWWFDFTELSQPGRYYVLDRDNQVRSPLFSIGSDVYKEVLRHALRTFFYQRAGQAKEEPYADPGWTDGASHLGPLQDSHCRRFDAPDDASTERDLSGGWYDAGDYNKYTTWTAGYVAQLLLAYQEHPNAFGDQSGIPESENGIPDVIDEARWGLDFLRRLQDDDGGVLCIVGLDGASPPSSATGQSLYGPVTTAATLATSAAFAIGSQVLATIGDSEWTSLANELLASAEMAWSYALANPSLTFRNNDATAGSQGLGAGQQEVDDYGRSALQLRAAVRLFQATGSEEYRDYVDANYTEMHLIAWSFAYPFEPETQDALLAYANQPGATTTVASRIRQIYLSALQSDDNLGAHRDLTDPYLAYLKDYVWGSNSTKAHQGLMFQAVADYGLDSALAAEATGYAEQYLHYLHGTNPLGLAYLSNMGSNGAERSASEFYHSWFTDGSTKWDRVGTSTYGPPPGFLVGGPNPSYDWNACCPDDCGSSANNVRCNSESIEPPKGQPAMKSYKDFNTGWPLDSWSVTENSDGYQVAYIRLLSKMVD